MSTINTCSMMGDDDDRDHKLHQAIMLSTQQTQHLVASIQASSAGIQASLCKVVECLSQNQQQQAQNHLQMMEMLKMILANNTNCRNGISNEEATINNLNERNRPSNSTVEEEEEEEENESSEINEQQGTKLFNLGEEVNQEEYDEYGFNFEGYEPLVEAIRARDFKKAAEYLHDHQTVIQEIFMTRDSGKEINNTLWDLGAWNQYALLREFLKLVPPEALEYVNPDGITILHLAAHHGDIKFVKALVDKYPKLTQLRSNDHWQCVPLAKAALSSSDGQKEVVEYLYSVTKDEDPNPFSGEHGAALLAFLLSADMYGLALSICRRYPGLVEELLDDGNTGLLQNIVERPFAFLSGSKLKWWEHRIYKLVELDMDSHPPDGGMVNSADTTKEDEENPPDEASQVSSSCEQPSSTSNNLSSYFMRYIRRVPLVKRLYHQKLMNKNVVALTKYLLTQLNKKGMDNEIVKAIFLNTKMLENAMKFGTTEFVLECLGVFPFLCTDDDKGEVGHTLMKLVASERNETVYNFMRVVKDHYLAGSISNFDENNNTILHFSAGLAHSRRLNAVSGAAFQMQREIQWFKMVENTMLQKDRFIRNKDGNTAQFLFTENHKELIEKGEIWMKDLSTSCMVVAALIATVAFASAITVPGGNISENGFPVLLEKNSFIVFAIADALALVSSVSSVLMFLAVFTSRYSEEDFLKALPQKLILGLATLFISMATMLVSFGAAFSIILGQRFHWVPLAISLLSCAPVLLFGFLQFPLFVEMVHTTHWPTILRKQDELYFWDYIYGN